MYKTSIHVLLSDKNKNTNLKKFQIRWMVKYWTKKPTTTLKIERRK